MGKIIRTKHIVTVIVIKLSSYLEGLKNIFDKQPDVKIYFDKQPDIKFASKLGSKFTNHNKHEATCYLQIVIVHGGVRESQPGYSEVKWRSRGCYLLKFL
jgi:hypothetical protein